MAPKRATATADERSAADLVFGTLDACAASVSHLAVQKDVALAAGVTKAMSVAARGAWAWLRARYLPRDAGASVVPPAAALRAYAAAEHASLDRAAPQLEQLKFVVQVRAVCAAPLYTASFAPSLGAAVGRSRERMLQLDPVDGTPNACPVDAPAAALDVRCRLYVFVERDSGGAGAGAGRRELQVACAVAREQVYTRPGTKIGDAAYFMDPEHRWTLAQIEGMPGLAGADAACQRVLTFSTGATLGSWGRGLLHYQDVLGLHEFDREAVTHTGWVCLVLRVPPDGAVRDAVGFLSVAVARNEPDDVGDGDPDMTVTVANAATDRTLLRLLESVQWRPV